MARKTGKTVTTTGRYAPAEGTDPEFDGLWDKVREALVAAGDPEHVLDKLGKEGDPRELLAERLVKFGGKSYRPSAAPEPLIPPDDEEFSEEGSNAPRVLRMPKPEGEAYWWEDPHQAAFLDHYILARRELGAQFHGGLLITGWPGTGKSESVPRAIDRINAAHGLSLRLTTMNCATVTDPQKWFGRREVDATGTHWFRSDFVEGVERGDVILLDDFTRLHAHIHNPIMSLLDGFNEVVLSDLNVTIRRHPSTAFIATANIGAQFSGTHRMDAAMRRRFPFTIERPFPPFDDEVRILISRTNCDMDGAANLVKVAAKTRDLYSRGDLRNQIDTGSLIGAAWLVASGMTEREALELTAIPAFDPDANGIAGEESERAKVRSILDGKAV